MIILLPIVLYTLIAAPYLFLIPGGDGDVEFKFAYLILHGTIPHVFILHPPLILVLMDLFFILFGYWSINFLGLLLGIAGIIAFYYIAKDLFDKKIALLSSCLLSLSGLYLATSLTVLYEFVMTVMIFLAFAYYLRSKYVLYSIFISLAVLTKETAIFFAGSVLLIELFQKKKQLVSVLIPFVVLFFWIDLLHLSGQQLWNEYNYSPTKSEGSVYTMFNNLITFGFFNKYAYENWLHLFVFNFNWVYTIFAGSAFFFVKEIKRRKDIVVIGVFFGIFLISVLGFQTWTINRYTLSLLPFLYLFAIYGASKLRFPKVWISIIFLAAIISMSYSNDPVSNYIWPKVRVFDQQFYMKRIDGGDAITYNSQYLIVMKERTTMLTHGQCIEPRLLSYDSITLTWLGIKYCPGVY